MVNSSTIFVHAGSCGARIGAEFWSQLASEQAQSAATTGAMEPRAVSHYREGPDGKLVPRAIFVDMESGTVDHVRDAACGQVADPRRVAMENASSRDTFGAARFSAPELKEAVMDYIRAEAEACDRVGHIHLTLATGGGTGSGVGSHLASAVWENMRAPVWSTLVMPSGLPTGFDNVLAPYNTMFALQNLIEYSDLVFVNHNDALHFASAAGCGGDGAGAKAERFAAVNRRIAAAAVAFEGIERWPALRGGRLTFDDVHDALAPYPRLKFLSTTTAVAGSRGQEAHLPQRLFDVRGSSIIGDIHSRVEFPPKPKLLPVPRRLMRRMRVRAEAMKERRERERVVRINSQRLNVHQREVNRLKGESMEEFTADPRACLDGHRDPMRTFFGSVAVVRSAAREEPLSVPGLRRSLEQERLDLVRAGRTSKLSRAVSLSAQRAPNLEIDGSSDDATAAAMSGVMATGDGRMRHCLERINRQTCILFQRRLYVHHYLAAGMDEMEFTEADYNCCDLASEYRQYDDLGGDDSDEDEEEEEEQ